MESKQEESAHGGLACCRYTVSVAAPHRQQSCIFFVYFIEWFGLEGTFKGPLVQPPGSEQGHLQLDQVAQSPVQPALECFQIWGICYLSGQPVPVVHHPHHLCCLYPLFVFFLRRTLPVPLLHVSSLLCSTLSWYLTNSPSAHYSPCTQTLPRRWRASLMMNLSSDSINDAAILC